MCFGLERFSVISGFPFFGATSQISATCCYGDNTSHASTECMLKSVVRCMKHTFLTASGRKEPTDLTVLGSTFLLTIGSRNGVSGPVHHPHELQVGKISQLSWGTPPFGRSHSGLTLFSMYLYHVGHFDVDLKCLCTLDYIATLFCSPIYALHGLAERAIQCEVVLFVFKLVC